MNLNIIEVYFDGCSKGNPGVGGAGAVIYKLTTLPETKQEIWSGSKFVGKYVTNNVAEYSGLILAMEKLLELNIHTDTSIKTIIKGDSNLVINHMTGKFKCKSENLLPLYTKAKELEKIFQSGSLTFLHVRRNLNARADELANDALIKTTRI